MPSGAGDERSVGAFVRGFYFGGRHPVLDGPWWAWVATTVVLVAVGDLVGNTGWTVWRWLAVVLLVALVIAPVLLRWSAALWRSFRAFGEGYRA